jgi:hypothetical protein
MKTGDNPAVNYFASHITLSRQQPELPVCSTPIFARQRVGRIHNAGLLRDAGVNRGD